MTTNYTCQGERLFTTAACGNMEITRRQAMRAAWQDLDKGLQPDSLRHGVNRGSAWETWYNEGVAAAESFFTIGQAVFLNGARVEIATLYTSAEGHPCATFTTGIGMHGAKLADLKTASTLKSENHIDTLREYVIVIDTLCEGWTTYRDEAGVPVTYPSLAAANAEIMSDALDLWENNAEGAKPETLDDCDAFAILLSEYVDGRKSIV